MNSGVGSVGALSTRTLHRTPAFGWKTTPHPSQTTHTLTYGHTPHTSYTTHTLTLYTNSCTTHTTYAHTNYTSLTPYTLTPHTLTRTYKTSLTPHSTHTLSHVKHTHTQGKVSDLLSGPAAVSPAWLP